MTLTKQQSHSLARLGWYVAACAVVAVTAMLVFPGQGAWKLPALAGGLLVFVAYPTLRSRYEGYNTGYRDGLIAAQMGEPNALLAGSQRDTD